MDQFDDEHPFQNIALFKRPNAPKDAEKHRAFVMAALDGTAPGSMWSLFHPDIVFHVPPPLPYSGAHKGVEAVKRAHAMTREYYDRMRIEVEQLVITGDLVLMYLQFNFRAKKNGRTGSFPLTEMYRFRDGKIVEWRGLHFDPKAITDIITAEP